MLIQSQEDDGRPGCAAPLDDMGCRRDQDGVAALEALLGEIGDDAALQLAANAVRAQDLGDDQESAGRSDDVEVDAGAFAGGGGFDEGAEAADDAALAADDFADVFFVDFELVDRGVAILDLVDLDRRRACRPALGRRTRPAPSDQARALRSLRRRRPRCRGVWAPAGGVGSAMRSASAGSARLGGCPACGEQARDAFRGLGAALAIHGRDLL